MKMRLVIATVTICVRITVANAADSISYERQIAPLLAIQCSICHGAPAHLFDKRNSGAPDTTSYAALLKDGTMLVVPHAPERSRILRKPSVAAIKLCDDFKAKQITRRPMAVDVDTPATARARAACDEAHHPTLTAVDAAIVTRWIEQGAPFDAEPLPKNCVLLRGVSVEKDYLSLYFKTLAPGLATVRVIDAKSGMSLLRHSMNMHLREYPSTGVPNRFFLTDLPKLVNLNFCQPYTTTPFGLVLGVGLAEEGDLDMASVDPPVLDPDEWAEVTFTTWQQRPSAANIKIFAASSDKPVFTQTEIKLTAGLNRFVWNRMTSKRDAAKPGSYVAYLTIEATNAIVAFYFQLSHKQVSPMP